LHLYQIFIGQKSKYSIDFKLTVIKAVLEQEDSIYHQAIITGVSKKTISQ